VSGSLDGGKTKLIDAREYALIITIDMNGVADVQSQRISRASAAHYLRRLADAFSELPGVGGEPE
jgi:hypothetical protein